MLPIALILKTPCHVKETQETEFLSELQGYSSNNKLSHLIHHPLNI